MILLRERFTVAGTFRAGRTIWPLSCSFNSSVRHAMSLIRPRPLIQFHRRHNSRDSWVRFHEGFSCRSLRINSTSPSVIWRPWIIVDVIIATHDRGNEDLSPVPTRYNRQIGKKMRVNWFSQTCSTHVNTCGYARKGAECKYLTLLPKSCL